MEKPSQIIEQDPIVLPSSTAHTIAPQLVEQKQEEDQRQDSASGKNLKVESGYSSVASSQSQSYLTQADMKYQTHIHERLQSLAAAAAPSHGQDNQSCNPPQTPHHISTQGSTGEERVSNGGAMHAPPGQQESEKPKSLVLSRFAPQLQAIPIPSHPIQQPLLLQEDGTPKKKDHIIPSPSTPTTPPKIQYSTAMTAPSSISPPPAGTAGTKRTISGVVKPTVTAISAPNSPIEVYPPTVHTTGGLGDPRVDPGRIQELSTQLRTRLKYARIKVDNNWTTKSLDQVESIYHSHQSSPAHNLTTLSSQGEKRDYPDDEPHEREDGLTDFGPPIHSVRRHHSRTASEPMNQHGQLKAGMVGTHGMGTSGSGGEKTYENFWKEKAPFTTKMLERMSTTTAPGCGQAPGVHSQQHNKTHDQQQLHLPQHGYHQHLPHHHQPHQQPYSQLRSPPSADSDPGQHNQSLQNLHHRQQQQLQQLQQQQLQQQQQQQQQQYRHQHHHHQQHQPQQQATPYSPNNRPNRFPTSLTPSHSNLSSYSASYNDNDSSIQVPATPLRHGHPSLSRATSSKSAEEEAVESLMFLMSSPGNNSTPRREPRMVQGYALNVHAMPRRGSILSRENSTGWATEANGDIDLDVTDAEEMTGGSGMEDVRGGDDGVSDIQRGRAGQDVGVMGYNRRRSNSGSGVMGRFDKAGPVKVKHQLHTVGFGTGLGGHHQERVTKPGGTPKKKLGVGLSVVGNGATQNSSGARRLAPGFSPS